MIQPVNKTALPGGGPEARQATGRSARAQRAEAGRLSRSSESETPDAPRSVTRGANSHTPTQPEIQMGWLRGTLPIAFFNPLVAIVGDLFPGSSRPAPGLYGYSHSFRYESGVSVSWSSGEHGANHDTCLIECPAKALEVLGLDTIFQFCRDLSRLGFRPTRIDASYDDYTRIFSPRKFYMLAKRGNVCGFRVVRWTHQFEVGTGRDLGDTLNFGKRGSKGSGAFYRFYDKAAESNGEINAYRIEVELSDAKAQNAWAYLLQASTVDDFHGRLGQLIGGHIDFRSKDTHNDPNLPRVPRCRLWLKLLVHIGDVKLRASRPIRKAEQAIRHAERVLPRLLARIREYMDHRRITEFHGWLSDLLISGRAKLTQRDRVLLKAEAEGVDLWEALFPSGGGVSHA